MLFCFPVQNFTEIGLSAAELWPENDFKLLKWRESAILNFRGPIMGSLKRPCATSCRSSIENHSSQPLNCLLLIKSRFFVYAFWRQTDRRTNKRTNRWTEPMHKGAIAVASGALINRPTAKRATTLTVTMDGAVSGVASGGHML